MGRQFYGNFGQDQSQCEAAVPGAAESGEISQRQPPGGW